MSSDIRTIHTMSYNTIPDNTIPDNTIPDNTIPDNTRRDREGQTILMVQMSQHSLYLPNCSIPL